METVHRVFYEFEILLAVNFIEREEKADIIEMVRRKVWGGVDEVNVKDTINEEIIIGISLIQPTSYANMFEPLVSIEKISNENTKNKTEDNSESLMLKGHLQTNDIELTNMPLGPVTNTRTSELPLKLEYKLPQTETTFTNVEESKLPFWNCKKCGAMFFDKRALNRHEEKKRSCWKICNKCEKEFLKPGDLGTHRKMSRSCSYQILRCNNCFKEYTSKKLFKRHQTANACKTQDLECKNCQKCFSSYWSLKVHKEKTNTCNTMVTCYKCEELVKKSRYEKHISRGCQNQAEMKCEDCLREFSCKKTAKIHFRTKQFKPTVCRKRILCLKCGKKCKPKRYQRHHCNFPCPSCGELFTEFIFKQHIEKKRKCRPLEIKCNICEGVFSGAGGLREHMNVEHDQKNWNKYQKASNLSKLQLQEVSLACTGCSRTFRKEKDLEFHQLRKRDCPAFKGNNTKEESDEIEDKSTCEEQNESVQFT